MLYTYKKLSEKVIKTIIIIKVKIPCAGADQKKQNCVLIRLAKQMASLTFEFIVCFRTIVLRFHCHCKNNYWIRTLFWPDSLKKDRIWIQPLLTKANQINLLYIYIGEGKFSEV